MTASETVQSIKEDIKALPIRMDNINGIPTAMLSVASVMQILANYEAATDETEDWH